MHTHTRAHRISFPTLSLSCLICTRLGLVFAEVSGIAEPATLQAMSDSDVDNLSALGDAEEVAEEGEGGGHMKGAESEYDIPSSPELQCSGCPASSKSECPLEALKGLKGRRIAWGKTSTRKVKCRRTGKRLRVIRKTGEWCRICYNIWRLRYKRKYKGDIKQIKSDLESKDEARKAMENSHAEYIHQKAGGRSRVNSLKGKVVAKLHYSVKVEYPREVFYTLKKYKTKFGCPKVTKAKVIKINIRKKGLTQGVIVREGEDGVFPIERSMLIDATKEYTLDDGECVLDQDQFEELMDLGSDVEDDKEKIDQSWPQVPSKGILSLEETMKRAVPAPGSDDEGGIAVSRNPSEKSDGSSSKSSASSSDDDDGSCSDSVASNARTVMPAKRRLRCNTPESGRRAASSAGGLPSANKRQSGSAKKKQKQQQPPPPQEQQDGDGEDIVGMKDVEADGLQKTLQSVVESFMAGAYVDTAGRDRQGLLRSWKEHMTTATACWKRIAVSKSAATRGQASPLKVVLNQVSSIFDFTKTFSKYPVIVFAEAEAAWEAMLNVSVKPPASLQAKLVSKRIEALLVEGQLKQAVAMLSIDPPAAGSADVIATKWGVHIISDEGLKSEQCVDIAVKVFSHPFTYRLPKEITIQAATEQATKFLEYFDNSVQLPPALKEELEFIRALMKFDQCTSADMLNNAIKQSVASQNPKRTKNTILSTFAVSKVGRTAIKDASTFTKDAAQNEIVASKLKNAAEVCKDFVVTQETAEGLNNLTDTVGLFTDALQGLPVAKVHQDVALIRETTIKLDQVFCDMFAARCVKLASSFVGGDQVLWGIGPPTQSFIILFTLHPFLPPLSPLRCPVDFRFDSAFVRIWFLPSPDCNWSVLDHSWAPLIMQATLDKAVLDEQNGSLQALLGLHNTLKAKLEAVKLEMPDDSADWEGRGAFAEMLAMESRRRSQFPRGYAVAPPLLVTTFASSLQDTMTENAIEVASEFMDSVPDFAGVATMLVDNTKAAKLGTVNLFRASVSPDVIGQLPLPADFQTSCIHEAKMPSDLADTLAQVKLAETTQRIDVIKGTIKVMSKIDTDGGNYPSMDSLDIMVAYLPALIAIARCQQAEVVIPSAQPPAEDDDFAEEVADLALPATEKIDNFLARFADVSRECKAVGPPREGVDASAVAKAIKSYVARVTGSMLDMATIYNAKMIKLGSELEELLIDPKPILKKLEERVDELIDFPGRPRIVDLIKLLNGVDGGGIKGLERVLGVLDGIDGTATDVKSLKDSVGTVKAVRGKGRTLLTCRTAAVMIKKKNGHQEVLPGGRTAGRDRPQRDQKGVGETVRR